jgi:U3 small nucleolar RNA-associated protein 4
VYTSGVDQKVTQFALVKPSSSEKPSLLKSGSHWIQASSKRLHSHDVRSVAIWPPYTPLPATQVANSNMYCFPADVAPILASGGLDMSVTLTPAALPKATGHRLTNPLSTSVSSTFEDSYHRRLAYPTGAAGTSALSLARSARMLACAAEAGISVWRLLPRAQHVSPLDDPDANDGGWEKILDMDLASQTNIISSSISDDGHWLVASDLAEAKLFSLKQTVLHLLPFHQCFTDTYTLRPREISSLSDCVVSQPCCNLLFLFNPLRHPPTLHRDAQRAFSPRTLPSWRLRQAPHRTSSCLTSVMRITQTREYCGGSISTVDQG